MSVATHCRVGSPKHPVVPVAAPLIALGLWLCACQPALLTAEEEGKDSTAATTAGDTDAGKVTTADDGEATKTGDDGSPVGTKDDGTTVGDDDAIAPSQCQSDGACDAIAGKCQKGYCIKGSCTFQVVPDTTGCNDGDPCTTGESCTNGGCGNGKPTDCDDKNLCTTDTCDSTKGCQHPAKTTGLCDDGVKCTSGDHCADGKCVGTNICPCAVDEDCKTTDLCAGPLKCDLSVVPTKCVSKGEGVKCTDDLPNDCTAVVCESKTGNCINKQLADGAKCEDGIPCTTSDSCKSGTCKSGTKLCGCLADSDCLQPTDLCQAQKYCDKSTDTWICKDNAVTKVVCDSGSDSECVKNVCDPKVGKCKLTPAPDGDNCTDTKCGKGSVCITGICTPSADFCPCKVNADCAKQEDGDVCNGTLFCNKKTGNCDLNPATVVKCATALDTACLKTLCNKKSGLCETTPIEKLKKDCPLNSPGCTTYLALLPGDKTPTVPCDDGDACSLSASCHNGGCTSEKTSNGCVCSVDADCASKDDGNKCNGTMYCNKALGKCEINPATIVTCATSNDTQCEKNVCDIVSGQCKQTIVGFNGSYVPCEDGNSCTQFDDCEAGKCVSGPNTCKCTTDVDCDLVEDGDFCNGTLFCNKATGACETNPATVVSCSNAFDTACAKNKCDKFTGKCKVVAVSDNQQCDDGNVCTGGSGGIDNCLNGECISGTNLCVCTKDADCDSKEDGNKCNGTLFCDKSAAPFACKVNPATVVYCAIAKDTDCTKNTCDLLTGTCAMKPVPQIYAACTDNNPCTIGDLCVAGKCQSGTNVCQCTSTADCASKDDSDPCNGTLACLTVEGLQKCATNPASVIQCAPSSECIINACAPSTGVCASFTDETKCNDNNPCTSEACTNGLCKHANLVDNTVCGLNKTCLGGQCITTK